MSSIVLRPFFRYYGGKWRAARHYPAPTHRTIVEPFAGAAGYSMRYPNRDVVLVEKYPVVAEIWRWLIGASAEEIRSIPLVDSVSDLPSWVPRGARSLIGFSMNSAIVSPRQTISKGALLLRAKGGTVYGWTKQFRDRVANQVPVIRHWTVIEGDYTAAPDVEATWFVDPPYQLAGGYYVHGSEDIDYAQLGEWCRTRRGQPIVCEQTGADWLPFRHLSNFKSNPLTRTSAEAIWP